MTDATRADGRSSDRPTRRRVLAAGAAAVGGVAGCLGGGDTGETVTPERQVPPPVAGDPDADVTVAVFEDFACPHCKSYNEQVVPDLRAEYVEPGRIAYVHYDFPVPVDRTVSWQAPSAARSVQARADAATFFAYAARLFANQSRLGPATYADLAREVGVDGPRTREAATEETYRPTVAADRETGRDRGVDGTPTVFVGDTDVAAERGDYGYESIAAEIDARL